MPAAARPALACGIVIAAFALGLTAASAADTTPPPKKSSAHQPASGHGMGEPWDGGPHDWNAWLAGLKLSPGQQESIKAITSHYRPRFWDLGQKGAAIRDQLASASPQDASYADVTRQAAQSAAELATEAVNTLSQLRVEIDAVLTPEQRKQLQDQVAKRQQRWEQWKSRHQPPAQ